MYWHDATVYDFDSLELSKKIILYDLYVRSEYRNKGIGRMLMNAAKNFAEEKV